jgi:hypothetical protein
MKVPPTNIAVTNSTARGIFDAETKGLRGEEPTLFVKVVTSVNDYVVRGAVRVIYQTAPNAGPMLDNPLRGLANYVPGVAAWEKRCGLNWTKKCRLQECNRRTSIKRKFPKRSKCRSGWCTWFRQGAGIGQSRGSSISA